MALNLPYARGSSEPAAFHKRRLTRPPRHSVILLGAGFSAPLGAPLIGNFFDFAEGLLERPEIRADAASSRVLADALEIHSQLRRSHTLTDDDTDNIEAVLSTVDLMDSLGVEPTGRGSTLRKMLSLVIEHSLSLPEHPAHLPMRGYEELVRGLGLASERITVITMNYDCLLEYMCDRLGLSFSYGPSPDRDSLEILKLHGSLNWWKCSGECKRPHVVVAPIEWLEIEDEGGRRPALGRLRAQPRSCPHCEPGLLVVPPTWQKDTSSTEALLALWRRAQAVLAMAESLVVIGYSLPQIDVQLQRLLHISLSPDLSELLLMTGADAGAQERWRLLFRRNWARNRLTVREEPFQDIVKQCTWEVLDCS